VRTAREIIELTAAENGVGVEDIVRSDPKRARYPREMLQLIKMQAIRRLRGARYSMPEIGRHMGFKDHSSVMYYLRGGGKRNSG